MAASQVLHLPDIMASFMFFGGLAAILITLICLLFDKFGFKLPFLGKKHVLLKDATQQAYDACRAKYEKTSDKKGLIKYDAHPYAMWREYPLHGKASNSNVVEPIYNLKTDVIPKILDGGADIAIDFEEISIKKSDLKQYIKSLQTN